MCIEGRPIASKIGAKSMFWSADGEAVKVEELALQYYASDDGGGWQGAQSNTTNTLLHSGLYMYLYRACTRILIVKF